MGLSFVLVAATLALAVPAAEVQIPRIPPASLDDSLEITGESLAAEQVRSRMFIDVRINETGPHRFLVDSGADRSVIGLGLARRLRLPAGEIVTVQGMAGPAAATTVLIDSLTIGSSVIPAITAPALPERPGKRGLGE